jgi:WD40 repeat protein
MTTWLPRCFAGLLLVLPFVPAVADDPDDKEIARLVKQLSSDVFKDREASRKRLEEIGEAALPTLEKAKSNGDIEQRRRAAAIMTVIEDRLYVEKRRLVGHTGHVWSISVSRDGNSLLTSSTDKTLRLWDADTGKCRVVFEGHTDRILSAAISPDCRRMLSGSNDGTIRLWDAASGKQIRKMDDDTNLVMSVVFISDDQAISGGWQGKMRLWDLKTGETTRVCDFRPWRGWCSVAYNEKTKLAMTCSHDLSIHLWNLEIGKQVRQVIGTHGNGIMNVAFSPDGKRIVSAGQNLNMRLWNAEAGKELSRIKWGRAYCAAFSPDGKRIVSGSNLDNHVSVWDIETGRELRRYEGHTDFVTSVKFFPDGKHIASTSYDGTARIWRAPR